ncbi:MAG TPA: D-alanyl-D-alanine carboxypeptidase/D-alanyl-D-alanine-endopeptidase, partial [Vicinamibacterales bacterium]
QAPTPVRRPATPPSVQPLQQLAAELRAITAAEGVKRGVWGVLVYSLDRRQRLFELNPGAMLVPASAAKLVTAASAYESVGWDFRFDTTVLATGPIRDGTLDGDLLVVGSGDPSIESRGWGALDDWVAALKDLGVQRIAGRIVGDDDAVEDPRPALAWAWDDLAYPTGALFGALNAAENRLVVTITPGAQVGEPAELSVEPGAAHRPLVNRTVTAAAGSPQQVWAEQRPAEIALTIAGRIRTGAKPVRLGVSAGNPTHWFAGLLRHRLVQGGIAVDGAAVDVDDAQPRPVRDGATRLYTHWSPPLRELTKPMLKDSVNLYGEALMRLNSGPGALPTNDAALEGLAGRFEGWGVPPDAQQLIDGSGLSRRDAVSAEALLAVLQRMYDPTGTSPFMQALPIAGVDGSLALRMRGTLAARNLRAKTGTMSNIRTLAGYVTTLDGEHLALVAMVNNFEGTGAQAVAALDAIGVRLASFSRTLPPSN